jgi:hypothetical protein
MTTQWINTLGILSTMIGAILIAVDVTRQYKKNKFTVSAGVTATDYMGSTGVPIVAGQRATETEEYKRWQRQNFLLMLFGLIFLLLGGVLQIVATWKV